MRLIFFFLLLSVNVLGQTNFSFTKIPTTATDLIKGGAGLEYWIYQSVVPYPLTTSPTGEANILGDRYDRFEWRSFENGSQGVYNWTEFDNSINAAIAKRQKFSFGIMTYCESCSDFRTTVGGADLTSYPLYLHNLMQAEATNSKDWIAPGSNTWVPNYNSPNYLNRHKALLDALAAHIASTSYQGIPYSRVIRYIDVRGIGNYNEWHHYGYLDDIPTGRFPTVATYKRVVDDYISAFPNFQLVALSDGYDTQGSSNTPAEVVSYLLTASNNVGKLGYRRDNIGSGYLWVDSKLENNPAVWAGVNLKDSITTRWKTAPAVGEMMNCCSADGGSGEYFDLSRQVTFYHINSFGNGNYESSGSANTNSKVTAAAKLLGFRYLPASGSMATAISLGVPFNITLNWINEGNSPTYERWYIEYELRNTTTNAVVWTGQSAYNLRGLIPTGSNTAVSENFTVNSIAPGTYRLHLKVRDSANYRPNMPLFINGVQSDGSYILRSTVVVSATGNQSPVAAAGANQSITLPTSSVTLSGSGTDADGTISSYAWTKISGTGGTIVSASSASTSVTGLSAGTYVFRLTVTDNNGATGTDDIQVTVNASAPSNISPVAAAGLDQTIVLPTSTVTLTGSGTDADGTIASYAWTRTYGPTATITSASSASTTITGITQTGIYGFRLTVTDNLGATAYDDIDIYVDPAPNVLPVANAGADKSITLPTSTVSLTGSGTDSDGSITAYNWAKVSGPAGQTISTPNAATTNITGLVQGTYVFRLRVTDNDGGQNTDNVTVTVNPEVVVPSTGNWIFTGTPTIELGNDLAPITLGTKFRATKAGAITRIRFYKSWTNTGTHVGGIYSSSGTLLQSGTFTNETYEGWQYLTLPDTVFVAANTTYVVALYCPAGEYGYTENYFLNSTTNNYMTAPASNSVGGNGVYSMGGSLTFPTSTFLSTNYWIDAEWLDIQEVIPANVGPSVSAGLDVTIKLPVSSQQVTATAADTDGTISTYAWSQISGPVTATISNTAIANPTISAMTVGGVYTFLITVTDDDGATASDLITIAVNSADTQWQKARTFIFNGRRIYFRR